ncbi:hypothetical protein [Clostridium sp.]|jgi:hypothetical protein|uniref:hypothetical protein n=1 Tax=Clostridium sp. TaxID=1506 RepID=UPI0039F5CF2D
MYDIKEKKQFNESSFNSQMNCIYDRSYFTKFQSENIINLKSSYIPKENLFEMK